jgi:tetratricopeptide (TPR) repeat protein
MGRYEEAALCYDNSLELDPRDFKVWASKGINLYSMGRKEEAAFCYDKSLELAPPMHLPVSPKR